MTDAKLLLDFPKILEISEKFTTINERINYLLIIKRDAQVLIQKANQSLNKLFGERVKPELINLPKQIDFEVSRLEKLKSFNINVDKNNIEESKLKTIETNENHNSDSFISDLFDVEKSAKYLNVSTSYIYKLTSKKLIRFSKPTGKKVFIKKIDLEKFIDDHKSKSKDDLEKIAINYLARNKNRKSKE